MHFSTRAAIRYGVDEAIMMNIIYNNVENSKIFNRNSHEEKTWMTVSVSKLSSVFSFWSEKQVRRILKSLKDKQLIETGIFNEDPLDATISYTLTQSGVDALI